MSGKEFNNRHKFQVAHMAGIWRGGKGERQASKVRDDQAGESHPEVHTTLK